MNLSFIAKFDQTQKNKLHKIFIFTLSSFNCKRYTITGVKIAC